MPWSVPKREQVSPREALPGVSGRGDCNSLFQESHSALPHSRPCPKPLPPSMFALPASPLLVRTSLARILAEYESGSLSAAAEAPVLRTQQRTTSHTTPGGASVLTASGLAWLPDTLGVGHRGCGH